MNIVGLRDACKGEVFAAGDAQFIEAIHGNLWNRLIPDRAPQAVVRAVDEDDVVAAVRFARASGLKVVVRGGGHNWCQPSLRHGGILIDLSNFTKLISIDADNLKAVIQPIISNRDIQKALNPLGLAFPTGHCPQVKASGYLLGGGMAWNPTVWGSGAESVEAIELVTAQGDLIKASATENTDFFWAARGAGSGFFGIVTKYFLKLHRLPEAMHGSTYYYRLEDAPAIGTWLGTIAPSLSPAVRTEPVRRTGATGVERTGRRSERLALHGHGDGVRADAARRGGRAAGAWSTLRSLRFRRRSRRPLPSSSCSMRQDPSGRKVPALASRRPIPITLRESWCRPSCTCFRARLPRHPSTC